MPAVLSPTPEALPVLRDLLHDEDDAVREEAIGYFGSQAPKAQALPVLLEALKDEKCTVRWVAVGLLVNRGFSAKEILPAYIESLMDADDVLRDHALDVLSWLPDDPETVRCLLDVRHHGNPRIRWVAITALADSVVWSAADSDHGDVSSALKEALDDKEEAVSLAALTGLVNIGADPVSIVPVVLKTARDRSLSFAEQAATQLGNLVDFDSVRLLTDGLSHPHARVRWLAARSLGEMGAQARGAALHSGSSGKTKTNKSEKLRQKAWPASPVSRER